MSQVEKLSAERSESRRSRATRSFVLPWWLPYVVLAVFAALYTSAAQSSLTGALSPLDEYQYHDYLSKVPTQVFVRHGEEIGELTRQIASCDGIKFFGPIGVECGSTPQEPDSAFPHEGMNSADIYTPVYFAITWLLAQPFTWLGLDLLDAGRAVGVFWLFGGLAAVFTLQRRLGVRGPLALAITLTLLALPATYWSTQFISTDAPTYAVGASLGLVALRFANGRGRLWELPAMAALTVAFKVNNLAAIGIVLTALLIYSLLLKKQTTPDAPAALGVGRTVFAVGASVLAVVACYGSWLVVRAAASVGPGADIDAASKLPFSIDVLVDEIFKFVWSVGQVDLFESNSAWDILAGSAFAIVGVGAVAISCVATGVGSLERRAIGAGTGLLVLLFGPLLALMTTVVAGYYVPLTGRYGIVFVVAYALLIGLAAQRIMKRERVVLALGVIVAGITVVGILQR